MSMGASTGQLYGLIGPPGPITKLHALDKACIPILLLGYTVLQLIMGTLGRFTEKKRLLFFALATWFLLCDGRRRDDGGVSFQSLVGHGNTVVGIIRGEDGLARPNLAGLYRPGCPQQERNLPYKDVFCLGFSSPHFRGDLQHSNLLFFTALDLVGFPEMSSARVGSRNDAVTGPELGSSFFFREVVREICDQGVVWVKIWDPTC
jgi:hypothetical protein